MGFGRALVGADQRLRLDHVFQLLPVGFYPFGASQVQVLELARKGNHAAHVVLEVRLLHRRARVPFARSLGVDAIVRSSPRGLVHGIRGSHRVIVDVPATRGEASDYLGEQTPLVVVGAAVDAHRGDDRVE